MAEKKQEQVSLIRVTTIGLITHIAELVVTYREAVWKDVERCTRGRSKFKGVW